jgi:hypothetical protein
MKTPMRILILIQVLMLVLTYEAKPQSFTWAKGISGSAGSEGIVLDANRNSYITGSFIGTIKLDTFTLVSNQIANIFFAKYDANGICLWAKQAGGNQSNKNSNTTGITLDSKGNFFVAGNFAGTATFDTVHLTSYGYTDILIAKYNSAGNCVWAKHAGDNSNPYINWSFGIKADSSGNTFVTGDFQGNIAFDTIHLTSSVISGFIAKYDPDGNCLWAKLAGGGSITYEGGRSVSIDSKGNSYVAGQFTGTQYFDNIQLKSFNSSHDGFLAKYNPVGVCLWAKQQGGKLSDVSSGVTIDTKDNIYLTGYFKDTASFGTIILIDSALGTEIFVAKYDSDGNCLWAQPSAGGNLGSSGGISVDNNSNTYITGTFKGTIKFDSTQLDSDPPNMEDIFVAKLDSNGNYKWAVRAGGTQSSDIGYSIINDAHGDCYVTGFCGNPSTFGNISLTNAYSFITKITSTIQDVYDQVKYIPSKYSLRQNYPNPFNPTTVISYSLPSSSNVKLIVYNTLGQSIKTLESGYKTAGNYSINFNASDLPSGIYFYKLEAGSFSQIKKMTLIK